jgi:hypothetical protein
MHIFYYAIAMIPIITYKWISIKCIFQDKLVERFHKPDSYLNNLIIYEYFTSMSNLKEFVPN